MNTKLIWVAVALIALWCLWPKKAKRATVATQFDPNETILAGQSAIYPLDKPNLNNDIGVYA